MKKVFQTKLKNITKVLALVIVASLATFTGCKSYDQDISKLNTDVAALQASVAALQTSTNGMTWIKSITMGTDGKLTITPSTGTPIVYDATAYVKYDISLAGNVLTLTGPGTTKTVTLPAQPALTFGTDNKLMSGTTVVADLSSWVRTLTLGTDNYLYINGVKSTILVPPATVQSVDVKTITISGSVLTITKNDNTVSTITIPATAIVTSTGTNGHLLINGTDSGIMVVNTFAVVGGFLTVNGVATTVAIPATGPTVILDKVGTTVVSTTITDATGATMTIKVNPSVEPLAGLLFFPNPASTTVTVNNNGAQGIEVGYINNIPVAPATAVKSLFTQSSVTFRLNPTSTDISATTWKIVNDTVNYNSTVYNVKGAQRAPGDVYTMFTPTLVPNTRNDGSQDFLLKVGTWNETGVTNTSTSGKFNTFALEATYNDIFSGKATKVVSDNVNVLPVAYSAFISKFGTSYTHYTTTAPAIGAAADFSPVYNASAKSNVNNMVLATAVKGLVENTFVAYNFGVLGVDYKFVFSVPTGNIGLDGITDDNAFIQLETNGDITILQGTAAIGRAPYIKAQLQTMGGSVLANGFIKLNILAASPLIPPAITSAVPAVSYPYASLFTGAATVAANTTDLIVNWIQMNNAYTALGVSHDQFNAQYAVVTPTATYTFTPGAGSTAAAVTTATTAATTALFPLIVSPNGVGVDTYAMKIQLTPALKFGTYVVTYTYSPAGKAPLNVVFTFTVTAPVLNKTILAGYLDGANNVTTTGQLVGVTYTPQVPTGEAFGYSAGFSAANTVFATTQTASKIDYVIGASHQFVMKVLSPVQTGYSLTNVTGTSDAVLGLSPGTPGTVLALSTPITTPTRVYSMQFVTNYIANGETDVYNYTVTFKNPLTVTTVPTANFTLTDNLNGSPSSQDLTTNYVVSFLGSPIYTGGVITPYGTSLGAGNITNGTFTYTLTAVSTQYVNTTASNGLMTNSLITWSNAGTKLTSQQQTATANFTYGTTFATSAAAVNPILVNVGN